MLTNDKTVSVFLTARDITLLRCGLLRRCDNLKGRDDMKDSYDRSIELLNLLFAKRKEIEL
jgi:hypothetical protein